MAVNCFLASFLKIKTRQIHQLCELGLGREFYLLDLPIFKHPLYSQGQADGCGVFSNPT